MQLYSWVDFSSLASGLGLKKTLGSLHQASTILNGSLKNESAEIPSQPFPPETSGHSSSGLSVHKKSRAGRLFEYYGLFLTPVGLSFAIFAVFLSLSGGLGALLASQAAWLLPLSALVVLCGIVKMQRSKALQDDAHRRRQEKIAWVTILLGGTLFLATGLGMLCSHFLSVWAAENANILLQSMMGASMGIGVLLCLIHKVMVPKEEVVAASYDDFSKIVKEKEIEETLEKRADYQQFKRVIATIEKEKTWAMRREGISLFSNTLNVSILFSLLTGDRFGLLSNVWASGTLLAIGLFLGSFGSAQLSDDNTMMLERKKLEYQALCIQAGNHESKSEQNSSNDPEQAVVKVSVGQKMFSGSIVTVNFVSNISLGLALSIWISSLAVDREPLQLISGLGDLGGGLAIILPVTLVSLVLSCIFAHYESKQRNHLDQLEALMDAKKQEVQGMLLKKGSSVS